MKSLKMLLALVAVAFALTACNKEEAPATEAPAVEAAPAPAEEAAPAPAEEAAPAEAPAEAPAAQ